MANSCSCSTLFAGTSGLEKAKQLVTDYKTGKADKMTPDLWQAKKVVDSTLHPGTILFSFSSYKFLKGWLQLYMTEC